MQLIYSGSEQNSSIQIHFRAIKTQQLERINVFSRHLLITCCVLGRIILLSNEHQSARAGYCFWNRVRSVFALVPLLQIMGHERPSHGLVS